jgi:drug/metabolite transporter (DMT)-like permease
MLRPGGGLLHGATLLSVGMALCFSLYLWMSRRMRDEDIVASLFYTAFSVWIVLAVGLPVYWKTPTLWDVALLAAIGLLGYVGIYGFDRAMESAPAPVVAPFMLTQPLFVVIADLVMRGAVPGRRTLLGASIVMACGIFLVWNARQVSARPTSGYVENIGRQL